MANFPTANFGKWKADAQGFVVPSEVDRFNWSLDQWAKEIERWGDFQAVTYSEGSASLDPDPNNLTPRMLRTVNTTFGNGTPLNPVTGVATNWAGLNVATTIPSNVSNALVVVNYSSGFASFPAAGANNDWGTIFLYRNGVNVGQYNSQWNPSDNAQIGRTTFSRAGCVFNEPGGATYTYSLRTSTSGVATPFVTFLAEGRADLSFIQAMVYY